MNEILQNLINTEKAASLMMVETKGEEGHDKIVAEVVRWLAENDLYVKLEKCK